MAPVGQLLNERLGRARIFERLGIDGCRDGRKPLDRVCQEKGLDLNEVLQALETCDAGASTDDRDDWAGVPMGELADHIVTTHHDYLRRELPRLARHVERVARVHGKRHPELREVHEVFTALKEDLELHILKEEKVLFPMIGRLESAPELPRFACCSINHPIHVMEHEHDAAGAALEWLRELTGGYTPPDDACNTYRVMLAGLADLEANLNRHIHSENHHLFPRASAVEAELLARAGQRGGEREATPDQEYDAETPLGCSLPVL
jgi:regulator of cell morphogenesis and NO signaling